MHSRGSFSRSKSYDFTTLSPGPPADISYTSFAQSSKQPRILDIPDAYEVSFLTSASPNPFSLTCTRTVSLHDRWSGCWRGGQAKCLHCLRWQRLAEVG